MAVTDLRIDPHAPPEALQASLTDPNVRWWAVRRLRALAATGSLLGAFNPNMHPRGRDGKFIDKFGWVRWLDPDTLTWQDGWVRDIDPNTGELTVKSGGQTYNFPNAKNLYSRPKRKAQLSLPNPISGTTPEGWKKVGGQGGSNPGGTYEVTQSPAQKSPELGERNQVVYSLMNLSQGQPLKGLGQSSLAGANGEGFLDPEYNVVNVPRLDGTQGRQDVLYKMGNTWYRVPASGSMYGTDGALRDDLAVTADEAFGTPGSVRRKAVLNDLNAYATTLGGDYTVDDLASLVQSTGSDLPQPGDKFYVKTMNIPERAKNEALANHLYEMFGVPVPAVAVGADGKTISSKILGNTHQFDPSNPQHRAEAQKGFVADALLANWDVIGLTYDNLQVDDDGRVWRIDAGGALAYRAQGKPKGSMFGDKVGELVSLTDKNVNAQAATVFGGISQADLKAQGEFLATIKPYELLAIADEFGMPELGPVLVARRQNILDQLGVDDTTPIMTKGVPLPAPAPPSLNPPSQGEGPKVAVSNYAMAFEALPTETFNSYGPTVSEATRAEWYKNAVFTRSDGDLFTYHSGYAFGPNSQTVQMQAKNLFTGQVTTLYLDGDAPVLADYARNDPALDNLVDDFQAQRDLAIAEIVEAAKPDSLDTVMSDPSRYTDVDAFRHYEAGIVSWDGLWQAWENGNLGETGPEGSTDWPIRAKNGGALYEVTSLAHDGITLRRRDVYEQNETTLTPVQFAQMGQWTRPGNDTTAELWKSKYAPDPDLDTADVDWDEKHHEQAAIDAWSPDAGYSDDKPSPNLVPGGTDDGLGEFADEEVDPNDPATAEILAQFNVAEPTKFVKEDPATWHLATAEEFDAAFDGGAAEAEKVNIDDYADAINATQAGLELDPDLQNLVLPEIEAAQDAHIKAAPTVDQKLSYGVVDSLGASTPYLSTEMALSDIEQYKTELIGKHVVVMPIESVDNPDWEAKNLGAANGLGTITAIDIKKQYINGHYEGGTYIAGEYKDVMVIQVSRASGNYSQIFAGEGAAKFPKVIIPVETEPLAMTPVFKQNGDITVNGVTVGTWTKPYTGDFNSGPAYYNYSAVIDADHSLTGKPMQFHTTKLALTKKAAVGLIVPVKPKPVTDKSGKVKVTEDEIKALNTQLDELGAKITQVGLEVALAESMSTQPTGVSGATLNDGSTPQVGDWVFSTSDGTYAQIKVLTPKFGEKKAHLADAYVKVAIPVVGADGKTTWKWTNRPKNSLVKANKPGDTPFVMQTKALVDSGGDWYGPGSTVYAHAGGGEHNYADAVVLDTTVDGNVKIKAADGSIKWLAKDKVFAYGSQQPEIGKLSTATSPSAASLNAELAHLNDQHVALAAQIANSVVAKPKKKKPVGTPYPGPNGMTVKQPAHLAEARTAAGLNNLKDGYAPAVGQILRHNDGTLYVVSEVGSSWSSHKNSIKVFPVGNPYDEKWRAMTTMVVDHESTLTDNGGDPLPIINDVFSNSDTGWVPPSGVLLRRDYQQGYWQTNPSSPGKSEYRTKDMSQFYIVAADGSIYNMDGTKLQSWNTAQYLGNSVRIGYLDKESPTGQKLTVSVQSHDKLGAVQYAVIHDADDSPGVILGGTEATKVVPEGPAVPDAVGPDAETTAFIEESLAATEATVEGTPTAPDLPKFEGKAPEGTEVPHPPVVSSSAGVPVFKAEGGPATLDVAGVPGARSVVSAIEETQARAKANKANNEKKWVSTYGLADHDVIEDMMVQTQLVRDAQGNDFVEVRFRLDQNAARKNHTTFITSTTNQAGDWEFANRNSKNLVPGDLIAVRIASGSGVTTAGALRPDGGPGEGKTPNATVVSAPVLIGKNKAGTYDVWRTQVVTANGDTGWIDLEDRDGNDTISTAYWDPTKPRTSNGAKGLNPNASNDGWSVKTASLGWSRSDYADSKDERDTDGAKKLGGSNFTNTGAGWTLQRDMDGAHIEYQTSAQKNSSDGQVIIRVPAGDPDAHNKISAAMEVVGVSKAAQEPPDQAALVKMATNKVWEQFNSTYTRGATPNSPQEALTAIDKAVGAQLGRKATMDDISLRMSPDGRVQVLVSEDVSRAIVAKNGIKMYTHNFSSSGFAASVQGAVNGENPGLMATTERWSHGLYYSGMSSVADHGHDSADHLFLRMSKSSSTSQSGQLIMDPVAIHRHVDYYWQPSDSYGSRQSNQLNWLTPGTVGGSNELMIQRRIEPDIWGHVVMAEPDRSATIFKLKQQGYTTAPNGQPLEDFFVASGGATKLPKQPPSFGDEIPLGSLPAGLPTSAPAAVV